MKLSLLELRTLIRELLIDEMKLSVAGRGIFAPSNDDEEDQYSKKNDGNIEKWDCPECGATGDDVLTHTCDMEGQPSRRYITFEDIEAYVNSAAEKWLNIPGTSNNDEFWLKPDGAIIGAGPNGVDYECVSGGRWEPVE